MNTNENSAGVLVRKKTPIKSVNTEEAIMNEIEKETVNNALATQFPEWDLKPPGNIIRRKRTKLS
ncbi:hypothetical protein [Planococcus halocryophilus]|uniref:hypothetical protein n=1 Tax=Planococcus halocryophilus TaxID=1215089 RepID=UPI001F0E7054|nr:hypothetical protein [Planococcus halocryophilus]MCH4826771.1 hypothetical protein [Planococcus halocryophilus]